jgi:hypothetical protein
MRPYLGENKGGTERVASKIDQITIWGILHKPYVGWVGGEDLNQFLYPV